VLFTSWDGIKCEMGSLPPLPDDVPFVLGQPLPAGADSVINTGCGSIRLFNPAITATAQTEVTSVHYMYYDTNTQWVLLPETYETDPTDPLFKNKRTFSSKKYQDYVRWCEYPGEALCETVSFAINGNPIDAYDNMNLIVHRQCFLNDEQKVAWSRLVGQQIPKWAKSASDGCVMHEYEYFAGY